GRLLVATRGLRPDREWAVFRALQFAQFTTTLCLEQEDDLRTATSWVPGIDPDAIVAAADEPETQQAFERDRDEARSAEGSPTDFQGKAANYDGRVRYTAPSIVLTAPDGRRRRQRPGWRQRLRRPPQLARVGDRRHEALHAGQLEHTLYAHRPAHDREAQPVQLSEALEAECQAQPGDVDEVQLAQIECDE